MGEASKALEPKGTLVLNYYQPWVWAGSERFTQLAREELRLGREHVFVFERLGDQADVIESRVVESEYANLALYEFHPPHFATPRSPYAVASTGNGVTRLENLVDRFHPAYVRSHFPTSSFLAVLRDPAFERLPFIYDVMDLWDEFPRTPWGNQATEAAYLDRADAIVVVSEALKRRLEPEFDSYVVPNAIDRRFLDAIDHRRHHEFSPRTRVLYIGGMAGPWFDWELCDEIVAALPAVDFTFVGATSPPPEEEDVGESRAVGQWIRRISRRDNARFFHEVPHDNLDQFLCKADIGIIPFKECNISAAVSPLKVFEYLGAGARVVQIGIPDIEGYPGVFSARDHRQFVSVLSALCASPPPDDQLLDAMAAFARSNTWLQRVSRFDEIAASIRPASGGKSRGAQTEGSRG